MTELSKHAPRDTWQHVCGDAIRIVNFISDRNIRNEDVKTRNFIVRKDPITAKLKVFMIDFACCELRRRDQDEQGWRELKAIEDEECAVGYVMQRYLEGGYVYHRTRGYLKLDEEFMMEED